MTESAFNHIQSSYVAGIYMGGGTGALLHYTPYGRFVEKRGRNSHHVHNEWCMNRFLDALGVCVPQATLHLDSHLNYIMLTEYEEGASRYQPKRDAEQVTHDFVPHALIANWDMLGLDNDNILRRPNGRLTYVDVGGSGPFRAEGKPKGERFTSTVGELDTLRDKNPYELGHITEQDIGQSFDRYGGEDAMYDALPHIHDGQTRKIMRQRIQDVARRVA